MKKDKNNLSAKLSMRRILVLALLALTSAIICHFVIDLDRTISATFNGKKWAVPATVYARPLELYEGAKVSKADLKSELEMLGYEFVKQVKTVGQAKIERHKITIYIPEFQFVDELSPARKIVLAFNNGLISSLQSSDDAVIVRLNPLLIGGIYPSHNEDRLLVKLDEMPLPLQTMLVAVEDSDFYDHMGISLRGIARAMLVNIKERGISQGASTLTQQLVKNYYLSSERSFSRKLQEAVMALLLEMHFAKEDILEAYINEIYLGQDGPRAIHGFGLASQYYFKRSLANLSLDQQALLVAIVKGPSFYNPWRHPERALERRNLVLDIAVRENKLSASLAEYAKKQPLGMGVKVNADHKRYPAYLDLVRRQLQRDYKLEELNSTGLTIFTHFDPLIQNSAETSLSAAIAKYNGNDSSDQLQGAVVVTHPNTGAVVAIVGGKDARYAGFNRAIDARRQVGSLLKPAVYLTALEQPQNYNLATLISDQAYTQTLDNGELWSPQNYDKNSHGDVMFYRALSLSYNQATARLGNIVGIDKIVETIARLGSEQRLPAVPSLTLGSVAMTPMDMAQIYQTIASEGFYTSLIAIQAVMEPSGKVIKSYPLEIQKRFSDVAIYQLRYALQAVTQEGTAKALQHLLPQFPVAGKTGTSNDLRDSWFAGFSGDMVAVVWIGRDDNANTGLTGATGALSVWANIFAQRSQLAIQNIPPQNISMAWVDSLTGEAVEDDCPNAMTMPFVKDYLPKEVRRCRDSADKILDWFRQLVE
ncbi:penicillin-binding protein 1B [Psychromonas sp. MME2]|uniref:penicillin-binding protein 1B n=1 Tax=unclassified Psychromonas TaxID=2614957 RepID=UPI00339D2D18